MIISIVNISRGSATALACEKPMNAWIWTYCNMPATGWPLAAARTW